MTKYSILYNTENIVQKAGANKDSKDLLITIGIILLVIFAITFLNSSKRSVPLEIENTLITDIENPIGKFFDPRLQLEQQQQQQQFDTTQQPLIKHPMPQQNMIQPQRPNLNTTDSEGIPHGVLNPNTAEYASV